MAMRQIKKYDLGRKHFAPDTRHKPYVRDPVVMKDFPPSPAKKPRMELYQEERRPFSKPVQRVADPKTFNPVKVIEKKPVLNAAAFDEWRTHLPAKEKREVQKRKPVPQTQEPKKPARDTQEPKKPASDTQEPKKPAIDTQEPKKPASDTAKPVEEPNEKQVTQAVPAVKEDKPEEAKRVPDLKPTVEPNEDGEYELSPLMSKILHEELQQIMIKVWQELPESPTTAAEHLVAHKFRGQAGDDLQKAMGLSVTSRLLNIHNPLYAKLHFSNKPEAGCLQSFIRDYNISAFKRIADKLCDTFAARFDDIDSFDRLCAHSEVKCGSATVTIYPCYKYLLCPPSVKTIYGSNTNKTKQAIKTNSISPQKQADANKTEKNTQSVKTDDAKAVDKKVNTATEKSVNKTQPKLTATDVIHSKTAETIKVTERSENEAQKKLTATDVINSKTAETVKVTQKSENKAQTILTATDVINSKTAKTVKATAPEIKLPDKVNEATKEVTKPKNIENEIIDKKNDVGDKNKSNDKLVTSESNEEMVVDDNDEEMTDQDILALMSGGIVLDECSGSDDEK